MIFLLCISALLPNFNTQYITDQLEILYNKLNSSKNYLLSMRLLINNDQDNIEIIGLNNLNSTQNKEIMITQVYIFNSQLEQFERGGVPFFWLQCIFDINNNLWKVSVFKNTISFQTTKEKNLTQIKPALDRKARQNLFIRFVFYQRITEQDNCLQTKFTLDRVELNLRLELDGSSLAGHSLQIFQIQYLAYQTNRIL